jgi:DNA-binding NarL/FixJ family response regulator
MPNFLKNITILIIDDHKMVRDGLRVMLSSIDRYFKITVIEAESGRHALSKISRQPVDLVIVDYQMPEMTGTETVLRILRFKPDMKLIALSNYDETANIVSMIEAGVNGYVLKNIEQEEMLKAIKTVLAGKQYFSNEIALKLIEDAGAEEPVPQTSAITARERQVLELIHKGLKNEAIARELHVSKRTIDSHRQNLRLKLNATNPVELLRAAYQLGILKQ